MTDCGQIAHVDLTTSGQIDALACCGSPVVDGIFFGPMSAGLDVFGHIVGAGFDGYYQYQGGSGDIPIKGDGFGGGGGGSNDDPPDQWGGYYGDPPSQWGGGWNTGDIPVKGGGYGSFGGGYDGDPPIEFDWGIE